METIWKLLMETLVLTPMPLRVRCAKFILRNEDFQNISPSFSHLIKTDIDEKDKEREKDAKLAAE